MYMNRYRSFTKIVAFHKKVRSAEPGNSTEMQLFKHTTTLFSKIPAFTNRRILANRGD